MCTAVATLAPRADDGDVTPPHQWPATEPLARLIEELACVVGMLSDAQYVQKPVGVVPSSVGGHVRHCLDHVRALLVAAESGQLDYDRRERGTPVESSRDAALAAAAECAAALRRLSPASLDRPLRVDVLLTADGAPHVFRSSVGRELAYVLSHTIHHNALIAAMVKTLGGELPERFGYAPSTIAFSKGNPCAR
jgi:uncharacterized damage-inducible protein DinB